MQPERFYTFDALRGLAAFSILFYHLSSHILLTGAWVAVDFFFILSGYVICHSYGAKISSGMGISTFITARCIRLMPLYLISIIIGAAAYQAANPETTPEKLSTIFIKSAAFIPQAESFPWPIDPTHTEKTNFPLNGPAWSLWFEIISNLIFFYIGTAWMKGRKIVFLPVLFVAFASSTVASGIFNAGWSFSGFFIGLIRVCAEFFLGAYICTHKDRLPKFGATAALIITATFFTLFLTRSNTVALANSIILAPLTVLAASSITITDPKLKNIAIWLGEISYPLYIIHAPIQRGLKSINEISSQSNLLRLIIISIASIVAAWALISIDARIRRFAMRHLNQKKYAPSK